MLLSITYINSHFVLVVAASASLASLQSRYGEVGVVMPTDNTSTLTAALVLFQRYVEIMSTLRMVFLITYAI